VTRLKVSTPVADFTGVVAGVAFVDGAADVSAGCGAVAYFRRHGYALEELLERVPSATTDEADQAGEEQAPRPAPMPDRWASTRDWRDWAATDGGMTVDEAAELDREQLVKHFIPEVAAATPTKTGGRQRKQASSKETTS
jgi:hypothetical protein